MNIHVLQHEKYETPGHITDWAKANGHELIIIETWKQKMCASNEVRFLIVLGGALNIDDVMSNPWIAEEKEFIKEIVNRNIPVLGVCLGSQLLAEALGAKVGPNPVAEIGWHEVEFDQAVMASLGLSHLQMPTRCLEWHSQTFEIPRDGHCFATSVYCKHQAFYANDRYVGLQFHPEWTDKILHAVSEHEPITPNHLNIQSLAEIFAGDPSQAKPFLFGLLDHFVDLTEGHSK